MAGLPLNGRNSVQLAQLTAVTVSDRGRNPRLLQFGLKFYY